MGCSCTSASLSCCPDTEFVQDKVCITWTGEVPEDETDPVPVIVFMNNLNQNIYATGYLKYDTGPGNITLQAVDATDTALGTIITLTPGTTASFTYRRFSEIQVILPGGPANEGTYIGEFCVTVRYPLT